MEQMDYYADIEPFSRNEQNRDGCRPGKLKTDLGMKAEDRNRHKLSAPVAYSLLGLSILLSAAALCVAVILLAQMGEMKRSDADLRVESSQWMSNVTGNVEKATSSLSDVQAEIALLRERVYSCPDEWTKFKLRCYNFSSSSANWVEAQRSCASADAHLVVINNAEEQSFLKKHVDVIRWIGLSDSASEGYWRWVDGTDYYSSVKFWADGQPNSYKNTAEDCVVFTIDGSWHDWPCSSEHTIICEKPAQ